MGEARKPGPTGRRAASSLRVDGVINKIGHVWAWVSREFKVVEHGLSSRGPVDTEKPQNVSAGLRGPLGADKGQSAETANRLSGATWWHANQNKFPNSQMVDDLAPAFRDRAKEFLAALDQAGAKVSIDTTRRNVKRAYLMHYSWMIANRQIKASAVPAAAGVDIQWVHPTDAASISAAKQMVSLFKMAYIASLTSHHIEGNAIDMNVTWNETIQVKTKGGKSVDIGEPRNGAANKDLHTVGNSYGVYKLLSDPPHWSSDGH